MNNTINDVIPESVRSAGREAQKVGEDVKYDASQVASRGRELASEIASQARGAVDDLSMRGHAVADHARAFAADGSARLSRAASRVEGYADRNTALVALASLGVGMLLGTLISRRNSST